MVSDGCATSESTSAANGDVVSKVEPIKSVGECGIVVVDDNTKEDDDNTEEEEEEDDEDDNTDDDDNTEQDIGDKDESFVVSFLSSSLLLSSFNVVSSCVG